MSRSQLIQDLYALYTQMTTANGFNYTWGKCESLDNGSLVAGATPQFHIKFNPETNDDLSNGLGNNEYQNVLPMTVKFAATMTSPSDSMKIVDQQIEVFKSDLLADIKRAFGNPYKINIANFYCGTEYNGEDDNEEENNSNDPYSVYDGALFTITYTESRGINEW